MDQPQGIGVVGYLKTGTVLKLHAVYGTIADITGCQKREGCQTCTPKSVEAEIEEHGKFHCPQLHDALLTELLTERRREALQPPSTPLKAWLDKWGVNLDWEAKDELRKAVQEEFRALLAVQKANAEFEVKAKRILEQER